MLPLLYQDDHLVVIDKPSGLLVHRTVLDWHETRFALQLLRDQLGRRVYAVHRLDKGTSGVLVFALDPDTARALSAQFEAQQVDKRYLAVVRGWPQAEGVIDHALTRRYDDAEFVDQRADHAPQDALTHYRTLATVELPIAVDRYPSSRYALVELDPRTGRRHQLRRHLKHIAHPIIGDATFGKGVHNRMFQQAFDSHRLLLHCAALAFTHPVSGQRLSVTAAPSGELAAVLAALGWGDALALQSRPQ